MLDHFILDTVIGCTFFFRSCYEHAQQIADANFYWRNQKRDADDDDQRAVKRIKPTRSKLIRCKHALQMHSHWLQWQQAAASTRHECIKFSRCSAHRPIDEISKNNKKNHHHRRVNSAGWLHLQFSFIPMTDLSVVRFFLASSSSSSSSPSPVLSTAVSVWWNNYIIYINAL